MISIWLRCTFKSEQHYFRVWPVVYRVISECGFLFKRVTEPFVDFDLTQDNITPLGEWLQWLLHKSWVYSALSNIRHDFYGLTKQVNSTPKDPDNLREKRSGVLFFKCVLNTKHQNHLGQISRPSPDLMKLGRGPNVCLFHKLLAQGKEVPTGVVTSIWGDISSKRHSAFQQLEKNIKATTQERIN